MAFQVLALLHHLPPTVDVRSLITLDSPLGGSPSNHSKVAYYLSCWQRPGVPADGRGSGTPPRTTASRGRRPTCCAPHQGACPVPGNVHQSEGRRPRQGCSTRVCTRYGSTWTTPCTCKASVRRSSSPSRRTTPAPRSSRTPRAAGSPPSAISLRCRSAPGSTRSRRRPQQLRRRQSLPHRRIPAIDHREHHRRPDSRLLERNRTSVPEGASPGRSTLL